MDIVKSFFPGYLFKLLIFSNCVDKCLIWQPQVCISSSKKQIGSQEFEKMVSYITPLFTTVVNFPLFSVGVGNLQLVGQTRPM